MPNIQDTSNHFDLLIIGGGINGAGIARDASLRGLKVLLVDKNDFASGTSSRSTKLIHGGIRYLEHHNFKLVWEACHERKILLKIAPQLVKDLPFIIPHYEDDIRPSWKVKLGLYLYDLMAGFQGIHRHRHLSISTIRKLLPSLRSEKLKGGGLYYDARTDDARLVLANLRDAFRSGAIVKNYTEVINLKSHEKGIKVECKDTLTAIKSIYTASSVVNATGPWLDLNLKKWHLQNTTALRLTKGIHFFIPKIHEDHAVLISTKKDQRIFFVLPWGDYSLVGTTDTDYQKSPEEVTATEDDRQYLLRELKEIFPKLKLAPEDIVADFAGLRPLLYTPEIKTAAISRSYQLKKDYLGSHEILSIIGGKITTYRHLAEKVTDRVMQNLKGGKGKCLSAKKRLYGSEFSEKNFDDFKKHCFFQYPQLQKLNPEVADNLLNTYGSAIDEFLPFLEKPHGTDKILSEAPYLWSQLAYSRQHEFVRTSEDFTRRRTELYIYEKKHPGIKEGIDKYLK